MSHNVTIMTHACEWLVETKLFSRLVDCMQGPRQMWLDVNCDTSDMWYEMCICMGEVTQLIDVTHGLFWLSRKKSHIVQCTTTEWIHLTKEMHPILCVDRTVRVHHMWHVSILPEGCHPLYVQRVLQLPSNEQPTLPHHAAETCIVQKPLVARWNTCEASSL